MGLVVTGSLQSLPTIVDLAGYRISQEALTNALKHGSDLTASFTISRTPKTLNIQVTNQADPPGQLPDEHERRGELGLVGMRERVTELGGSLSHGLRPDGAFELTATIPLCPEPAWPPW